MRDESGTDEDRSRRLGTHVPWRVVDVRPLAGLRLAVQFADGTPGEVDVSRLVAGEGAGVFACLRDPDVFAQVGIDHGAVTWPGEIDLAPDAMYDEIKANGRWVLE
jgi:hypothetical protein